MRERIKKTSVFLITLCLLVIGTSLSVSAAVRQKRVLNGAIEVTWDKPSLGSYNTLDRYHITVSNYATNWKKSYVVPASAKSYTVKSLPAGSEFYVKVEYDYTYKSSYSTKSYTGGYVGSSYFSTLPQKVSGLQLDYVSSTMKYITFKWTKQNDSHYNFKIMNASGKVVDTDTISIANWSSSKVSGNQFYTIQVRGCVYANGDRKTPVYGPWSDVKYFVPQPALKGGKKYNKVSNGTLKLRWTKVKGATSYSVYVSTKEKRGFKKVKTTKKTKVTLKKFKGKKFKNNKKYYFYILANKKVGKTTIKSPYVNGWWVKRFVF